MSHGSISHQFDVWVDDGMDRKWDTGDIDGRHVKHFIVAWMTFSKKIKLYYYIPIFRGGHVRNRLFKIFKETGIDHFRGFLYAEIDSGKISDRLSTLKGRF
jgi:hypothetical protein